MNKNYIRTSFIALCLLFGFSQIATAALVEGEDYTVLAEPVNTSTAEGKIEVIEFFSYGCPYCYKVEPQLAEWLAQKPDNVEFIRVAIPRKGRWVEYARLFYALKMISNQQQEQIMPLIYAAIHEQKIDLDDADKVIDWAVKQGVNRDDLTRYYYSDAVTEQLTKSLELAQAYQLKYVPSVFVDGKYSLVLNSSNNYQGTKDKLNELTKLAEK